eukprot:5117124-Prymnesium_polylepis.1
MPCQRAGVQRAAVCRSGHVPLSSRSTSRFGRVGAQGAPPPRGNVTVARLRACASDLRTSDPKLWTRPPSQTPDRRPRLPNQGHAHAVSSH